MIEIWGTNHLSYSPSDVTWGLRSATLHQIGVFFLSAASWQRDEFTEMKAVTCRSRRSETVTWAHLMLVGFVFSAAEWDVWSLWATAKKSLQLFCYSFSLFSSFYLFKSCIVIFHNIHNLYPLFYLSTWIQKERRCKEGSNHVLQLQTSPIKIHPKDLLRFSIPLWSLANMFYFNIISFLT